MSSTAVRIPLAERKLSRSTPIEVRLWSRVSIPESDGDHCWTWTGPISEDGYGLLGYLGKTNRAHRVAYILAFGPIYDGLHVLHRCDNPPCCRPDHLFLGTNADNVRDAFAKGRRDRPHGRPVLGAEHGCAKLSPDQVRAIRRLHREGQQQASLARRFGIGTSQVNRIV